MNDSIISKYTAPAPIGGNYHHFYKTVNPLTNFGPYTQEEIDDAINSGALFISYLGHSGTQTWDNSISDYHQLSNNRSKYSLISDFGCSTGKFAEPDVTSFSEMFVNNLDGSAINYIGNSSLGFSSTATTFPPLFYKRILIDSVYNIEEAHNLAKVDLMNEYGTTEVNELFSFSNILIGDPIITLPIPKKPNFNIGLQDITTNPKIISDNLDSVLIKIFYYNLGRVDNDSISILVKDTFNQTSVSKLFRRRIPLYKDSLETYIPVKDNPGLHQLSVKMDPNNQIDEIFENDNYITFSFNVSSSQVRTLLDYDIENAADSSIIFLNPTLITNQNQLNVETSIDENFNQFTSSTLQIKNFYSRFNINSLNQGIRYWIRAKLVNNQKYSASKSFVLDNQYKYVLSDSFSFYNTDFKNSSYKYNKVSLDTNKINFDVISAGYNDGRTALILKNSENFIPENTKRGHHICVFDDSSFKFITYKNFDLLGGGVIADSNYIDFLDSLNSNVIVIFAVSDDGRVADPILRNKIKEFGSIYIDSLHFRGSWAMIGKKGVMPGSVPEAFSIPFGGRVEVDTTYLQFNFNGSLKTSTIGPSNHWSTLNVTQNTPANSSIKYRPLAVKSDGTVDTLNYLTVNNGIADLSFINSKTYPFMKILAEFNAASDGTSPALSSLGVNYTGVPELGTNYQVVSVDNDSVKIGQTVNLNFSVYNAGESRADSFKVHVDVVKPDNSTITLLDTQIDTLNSFSHRGFSLPFNTLNSGIGRMSFNISIDPENKITELYKDNNYYTQPFYVLEDSTAPDVKITFDGVDIIDGDFVSANPTIKINLDDPSSIPITDTSAIAVYLNDELIPYMSNSNILTYEFSNQNPKMTVTYKPTLKDGEYNLRVMAKNSLGNFADSVSSVKNFTVNSEAQLLYVYNYPNPFSGDTYFTFKLTQIPDELKIKVYTIAGRLVRNIVKHSSELNYDFNRIFWDGRDEDGDLLANGVYLYKVIMEKGGKTIDVTQKLAIIR